MAKRMAISMASELNPLHRAIVPLPEIVIFQINSKDIFEVWIASAQIFALHVQGYEALTY
jgi:hypothetical protein